MAQDQRNTPYEITFDTPDLDTYQLTAAYTSVDERLFPGWVLFKDEHGTVVAKARADRVLAIARADVLLPAVESRDQAASQPLGPPSPRQLADLAAAHGRKPCAV